MKFLIGLFMALPAAAVNLEQAVQSSLGKNETVGQSRAQLQQMQEKWQQVKGGFFPQLSLNGSYLIQPKVDDPLAAEFFPERQTTANLTLTQALFRGGSEYAAYRKQKNLSLAQEQIHVSQLLKLYEQVATSYLEVLSLQQDLRNVDAQRSIYTSRVKDLQARTRRGESSLTESLTAQSTAAALEAEYQIVNSRLKAARENFAVLTGLPGDAELAEMASLDHASLQPLNVYLNRIDERADIRALKEQALAADEDVGVAKGGHLPSLDLVGNYYFVRPDGYTKDLKWDVQFRLTMPLFEGGIRQSLVRESAARKGEVDLTLQRGRRQAEADIKALHENLRIRGVQLESLKLAADLGERNYQVLLRDSRRGLARSLDVQMGLTEYRNAKRNYDQARYQAQLEKIKLDLATAKIPDVLVKEL